MSLNRFTAEEAVRTHGVAIESLRDGNGDVLFAKCLAFCDELAYVPRWTVLLRLANDKQYPSFPALDAYIAKLPTSDPLRHVAIHIYPPFNSKINPFARLRPS